MSEGENGDDAYEVGASGFPGSYTENILTQSPLCLLGFLWYLMHLYMEGCVVWGNPTSTLNVCFVLVVFLEFLLLELLLGGTRIESSISRAGNQPYLFHSSPLLICCFESYSP